MPDQNGQRRTMADFQGKVTLLFFGYTQCPDVCPTTLSDLAAVKQKLGAKGDKLQVVFVSVDPARDTSEVLKSYIANFDPSFLALRGSDEELAKMAKDFGSAAVFLSTLLCAVTWVTMLWVHFAQQF